MLILNNNNDNMIRSSSYIRGYNSGKGIIDGLSMVRKLVLVVVVFEVCGDKLCGFGRVCWVVEKWASKVNRRSKRSKEEIIRIE